MKFETGQTLFFSDVLAPLSSTGSRDEKVTLPDTTMATPANENVIRLSKGTYKSKFFLLIWCLETSLLTLLASVDFYESRLLAVAGKDLLFNKSFIFWSLVCHFLSSSLLRRICCSNYQRSP